MEPLIFIGAMIGLMWLLVIRPQRRRASEHGQMVSKLSVDDEIVTAGGLYGRIMEIDGDVLTVQIAPEVIVRLARGAVTGRVEPEEEQEVAERPERQTDPNGPQPTAPNDS